MPPSPPLPAVLRQLPEQPLLGRHREQVAHALRELSLQPHVPDAAPSDSALPAGVIAVDGELALLADRPGAGRKLLEAARLYRRERAAHREQRCRYLAARALHREGLPTLAHRLVEIPPPKGAPSSLQGHFLISRSWPGGDDAPRALREGLALLAPSEDHHRLAVHARLAEWAEAGGHRSRARQELEAALAIAEDHRDAREIGRLAALLSHHLLRSGRPHSALPLLRRSVEQAALALDDLTLSIQASILAAHLVQQERWEELRDLARLQAWSAERRNTPLARADAALNASAAHWGLHDPARAIGVCRTTALLLREQGAHRAAHPLLARLAEYRSHLGAPAYAALVRSGAKP